MNRNSAGNQWRNLREQTGLEEFTLHDLRHFYTSALIAAGCDVATVQRALGHSSATITLNTYSNRTPTATCGRPPRIAPGPRPTDLHARSPRRTPGRRSCGLAADWRLTASR